MNDKRTILLLRILRWVCPSHLYEEIEGDLLQEFKRHAGVMGERKARLKLFMTILRFLRPGIILRHQEVNQANAFALFVSQSRFTLRHLRKQRSATIIHIAGLTVGLTVCMLIGLFIAHQTGFDGYHKNAGRIYRVNSAFTEGSININLYATPLPLSDEIRKNVSGVEKTAFARPLFKTVVEALPGKRFVESRILVVEPQFVDIFDIEILQGGLRGSHQAILSESTVQKYFGGENPIGRTITLNDSVNIAVTGIMKDPTANTGLPASMLVSYSDNFELIDHGDTWYFGGFPWVKIQPSTYVLLEKDADIGNVSSQLKGIADANINAAPTLNEKIRGNFELQPLGEIHFDTRRFGGGPWVPAVNPTWLWFFASIGGIVLILACVNFLNLSTARSATRAKEVGIRKSIGALGRQLIVQFWLEALFLVSFSMLLALLLVSLSIDTLSSLAGQSIAMNLIFSAAGLTLLLVTIIVVSLLSGLYPALVISRFNPASTLKTGFTAPSRGHSGWMRQGLVATQFVIASVLIAAVLILSQQVSFMYNSELGFEKKNVMTVEIPDPAKGQVFTQQLIQQKEIVDVSLSRSSPISVDHWWNSISQTEDNDQRFPACSIHADERFLSLYGIKLLAGRMPAAVAVDPNASIGVVVNENLLLTLGLGSPDEALGKEFWWGGNTRIVGVVADFNTEPLKYGISPTIISQDPALYTQASIKLSSGTTDADAMRAVEHTWRNLFPEGIFEGKILEEEIKGFYSLENKVFQMFRIFALIAIAISCLGLWGLSTYLAQTRTKEIGIRKVLGASVRTIAMLLSREFFITIGVALLVGSPLAYMLMRTLLSQVAYRVPISWSTFAITGLLLTAAGMLTVGIQTYRSATSKPVNALKDE